jgi:hypothetical protein
MTAHISLELKPSLTSHEVERLVTLAEAERRSPEELIISAIREYIANHAPPEVQLDLLPGPNGTGNGK